MAAPPPGFAGHVPSLPLPNPRSNPSSSSSSSLAPPLTKEELATKSKKWVAFNSKRFNDRSNKTGIIDTGKQELPPEHVRKIMKDHGDMSNRKYKADKRVHLGALKYVPHAMMKLIENIPMPWEVSSMRWKRSKEPSSSEGLAETEHKFHLYLRVR